jgi:hypothetical protein
MGFDFHVSDGGGNVWYSVSEPVLLLLAAVLLVVAWKLGRFIFRLLSS